MKKKLLLCVLSVLVLAPAAFAGGRFLYKRDYHAGDAFDYVLKTDTYNAGKFASESVSESHHLVVLRGGVPFERVTFVGMKVSKNPSSGHFTSLDAFARKVEPFYISLAPGGSLHIPKLAIPHMTGPVTDLVTYWVALSPKSGIDTLHRVGDQFTAPKAFGGKWSNSGATPLGRDELSVTNRLVAESPRTVTFEASFLPPAEKALTMAYSWMRRPVSGTAPNNFEQVSAEGGGKVYAMWGREDFTITATVDRANGMILDAKMVNHLHLRLRLQCTSDFSSCGPEFPYSITRKEQLSLVR